MTVIDFKSKTAVPEEESPCDVLEHIKGKKSIIAIAADSPDDAYELYISDDLKRFDIIALLDIAKLQVELGHIEGE